MVLLVVANLERHDAQTKQFIEFFSHRTHSFSFFAPSEEENTQAQPTAHQHEVRSSSNDRTTFDVRNVRKCSVCPPSRLCTLVSLAVGLLVSIALASLLVGVLVKSSTTSSTTVTTTTVTTATTVTTTTTTSRTTTSTTATTTCKKTSPSY